MKEALLHHLWKTKKFDLNDLKTTDGEELSISNFGIHNHDAGPDFLNGKIKVGDTTWNGHIEIHIKASDWNNHKHQNDPAYNSVILHVVYQNDKPITNKNGQPIPTLELRGKFPKNYVDNYEQLTAALSWIPCEKQLATIDKSGLPFFLERILINRLVRKQERIQALLDLTKNDWEEVLYRMLMRYFGLKVNGEAFERLAEAAPLSLVKKQGLSVIQKESLLFGQAGLLQQQDEHFAELEKEYKHQRTKYKLIPMTGVEWKFSKLRPPNFPTIRIAQIAALYHATPQLFSAIVSEPTIKNINELLNVSASAYWDTHYLPTKVSSKKTKRLGQTSKDVLMINVVVPLLFTYASQLSNESLKERALTLLTEVKAENNNIIRRWKEMDIKPDSAAQSQALIELKNEYCSKYDCLNCQLGQQILFG